MFLNINRILNMTIFRRVIIIAGTVYGMLLFNGCESLPPGDAPKGLIVIPKLPNSKKLSINMAVNYMTTSLSATCIRQNLRGVAILKLFSDRYSNEVFSQVAEIAGLITVSDGLKPELQLTSKFIKEQETMIWEMRLIRVNGNKVIWHDKVTVKRPKP